MATCNKGYSYVHNSVIISRIYLFYSHLVAIHLHPDNRTRLIALSSATQGNMLTWVSSPQCLPHQCAVWIIMCILSVLTSLLESIKVFLYITGQIRDKRPRWGREALLEDMKTWLGSQWGRGDCSPTHEQRRWTRGWIKKKKKTTSSIKSNGKKYLNKKKRVRVNCFSKQ